MNFNSKVNEKIRAKEVRVIGPEGEQLGIMPTIDAMKLAAEKQLDLVEVSSNTVPVVCKILNYGKYRYEKEKDDKKNKKKQKIDVIKEIKVRGKIAVHDLEVKEKRIKEFLEKGYKVKVTLEARGRERALIDKGLEVLNNVAKHFSEISAVDKGYSLKSEDKKFIILSPKPKKDNF